MLACGQRVLGKGQPKQITLGENNAKLPNLLLLPPRSGFVQPCAGETGIASRLQSARGRVAELGSFVASSRGHLKTIRTLFIAPLAMGLAIAVFALTGIGHEDYGVLQWSLAILAVLLVGLFVGGILNLAIFAPVYWFLGRLHSKRTQTETRHDDNA
jgi:hypothetical protein